MIKYNEYDLETQLFEIYSKYAKITYSGSEVEVEVATHKISQCELLDLSAAYIKENNIENEVFSTDNSYYEEKVLPIICELMANPGDKDMMYLLAEELNNSAIHYVYDSIIDVIEKFELSYLDSLEDYDEVG